jgi:hypothetical protein
MTAARAANYVGFGLTCVFLILAMFGAPIDFMWTPVDWLIVLAADVIAELVYPTRWHVVANGLLLAYVIFLRKELKDARAVAAGGLLLAIHFSRLCLAMGEATKCQWCGSTEDTVKMMVAMAKTIKRWKLKAKKK